jgi:6-pyruvoyl-tetrahydropterin synthase related domain
MKKAKTKTTRPSAEANGKLNAPNERKTRLLITLLCIGLSAFAVVPFFFMGRSEKDGDAFELRMPATHDMFLHYDQMRSFYNGLAAGEIYPRWEEDTNRGFGAPTTSYYPPGVYYLTSAFYAITRDWLGALLGAHLVMMIAAAASLYIYARQVMGRGAAMAAMVAYVLLPYHMVDQYQRGAMAELLVFAWMPLMLLFGERLMKAPSQARKRSVLFSIAGLAASYGAFLWSHPPTAYQFTLGFGVYMLVLSVMRKEWKGLVAVSAAMALGIGLAAVYLLPAAIEQNLIHKEFISETWPYHKTYIFVHDLYNSDFYSGFFKLIDWIWITGTAVVAVAAITLLWLQRRALESASALKQRVLLWVILGGLASFMMTRASMPLGRLIPKIDIGVFTWRMLAITTLVVALIAGAFTQAAIDAAARRSPSERLLFGSLAAFIIVGGIGFSAVAVVRPAIEAAVFEPEPEHLNSATIPSSAPADPGELADDVPQAELATEENGEVVVEEWKPQHRVVRADLVEDDELLVRTFNFPGWTAAVDGQQVPIKTSEELGDMEIELRSGLHRVTLDFLETPVRRAFRIVTLCSFGLLIALGFAPLVRRTRVSAKVLG